MKTEVNFKGIIVEVICLLYVVLFVYAAVSKFMDFQNFQVQLGQSPLLSAFAGWISWIVPVTEIIIATGLIIARFRLVALYASFGLMTMFTTYIIIILNFSDSIPCSCGGVLEKMGWTEHLVFNIIFMILAVTGIAFRYFKDIENPSLYGKQLKSILLIIFLFSISIAVLPFFLSEKRNVEEGNFVRYFPHHPLILDNQVDLVLNSYYIAGFNAGKVYLGNVTAPLSVTIFDALLKSKQKLLIELPVTNLKFRSLRLSVSPPYFYLYDGTTSVVFRGKTSNWNADLWLYKKAYFTHLISIDSTKMAIKALSSSSLENVLGTLTIGDSVKVNLNEALLEKQTDGVFDTDGILLYNATLNQLIYTYYYRNEFVLADTSLQLNSRGNTIDTINKARIKVAILSKKNLKVLAEKPVTVNRNSATSRNFLFIQSGIIGNYESKEMWRSASIIDVYNIKKHQYLFSFYLPHKDKKSMSSFWIDGNQLIAVSGQYLSIYKLKPFFFKSELNFE